MGLLSNKIDRESLKPGDHIYTWRTAYIYAHHGIYVGDDKVIHFTTRGQEVGSGTVLPVSSCLAVLIVPCLTCLPLEEDDGILLSCLKCFLAGGNLYRFEYNVTRTFLLAQIRGGTCSFAKSDSLEIVVHRAQFLLDNQCFGCYDTIKNNCEDFAIYCKTGFVAADPVNTGKSGQARSFAGVPVSAISSAALCLFTVNPYAQAAMAVGMHYINRVGGDVGIRSDVVKIEVEDLTKLIQLSMQSEPERLKFNESELGDKVDEEHRFVQAVEGINKKGTVDGYVKKSTTSYPEKSSNDELSSISELGDKVDEEHRFVQAVEGINKKGTVYGYVKKSTTSYPEKSSNDDSSSISELGDKVDEEHRFVQAVEGINKKGTVYGYVKKSTTSYPEKSSNDDSSSISKMEARLQKSEDELQATRKMLKDTQEMQKLQGELIASLISRSNGCS